ncbi:glycosyltransferase [Limosilactobacillus mucosae]|uniref:glycosyltransferase n=1 Tax=Limosilactobacillus mucosae TaxID=97478 RepID=UPI0022E0B8C1|nr:glycosyltransferase [Limosilactobacillus mucosae]
MKIGCIIVLYKPNYQVVNNIKKYPKLYKLVLIDNSPNNNSKLFESILSESVTYIPLLKNMGIAHALNIGVKDILNSVDYIITMDQDSKLNSELLLTYQNYINKHKRTFALTPQYNTGRCQIKKDNRTKKVSLSMQSGTLFNVEVFKKIGYFDERLFIDVVDWEFFLRMKKYGLELIRINRAILEHQPAITKEKYIGPYKLKYGVASPLRYYYQARNLLWVARRYRSLNLYVNLVIKWLKIILLFDNKKEYLLSFYEGVQDAIKNKLGEKHEKENITS